MKRVAFSSIWTGRSFDHHHAIASALGQLLTAMGDDQDRTEQRLPLWLQLESTWFGRNLNGDISFVEQQKHRLDQFAIAANLEYDETDFETVFARYSLEYERSGSCYSDVVPCLEALGSRSYVLGVLTNANAQQQR